MTSSHGVTRPFECMALYSAFCPGAAEQGHCFLTPWEYNKDTHRSKANNSFVFLYNWGFKVPYYYKYLQVVVIRAKHQCFTKQYANITIRPKSINHVRRTQLPRPSNLARPRGSAANTSLLRCLRDASPNPQHQRQYSSDTEAV